MKKLLLALGLVGWATVANAQCISVGGATGPAPQPGIVCASDSTVPTYFVSSIGIVPGTAPTDIFCLTGSATKVARVKRVRVTGTAGTAINITTYLTKHTVANTGGTAAATVATGLPVLTAADSTFAATTLTATAWTANPTIDSSAVNLSAQTLLLPVTSTATAAAALEWEFNGNNFSPLVLRGVAQQACINFNGVTAPSSGVVAVSVLYTEQAQ